MKTNELAKPAFRVERHGSGWAIYQGRDELHHGCNLGHLTETNEATAKMLEERLNAGHVEVQKPEPVGVVTCDAGGTWGLLSAELPIGAKLYREPICCSKQAAAPQMWRVRMPYWQSPGIWNEMPKNERARAELDYWVEKAQTQGGVIEYAVVTERVAEGSSSLDAISPENNPGQINVENNLDVVGIETEGVSTDIAAIVEGLKVSRKKIAEITCLTEAQKNDINQWILAAQILLRSVDRAIVADRRKHK